ncbi:glycosyltransferase [Halomonas lysinitropha]|uniref:D-inositol 3-phosphate glycosyltransferase n=1 Tax=Halomonas lysinitropha TaxID=2607506 RepID=A0A5K1IAB3_9GAMM|nr:glycosyltransferase [Halomonas lysinitropha]VVZ97080.1 D-inositol 3-phosphate glycosyltransferase [Halomonas lysinitropha]
MRIVLLSGASSIHTIRWANGLCGAGHEIHVITQHSQVDPFDDNVVVHPFPFRGVPGYFTMVPKVRRLLKQIKPDLVNAHYASGYGTTARLVNFHPWLLSVWGSDVYDFPHKSPLHKWLVKKNLRAADHVASTSHCMAEEVRKLAPELDDIAITPFGIDLEAYAGLYPEPPVQKSKLVIGTVKTMKPKYGIDTLIEAYALVVKALQAKPELKAPVLELRLVGGGEHTPELQALAERLGIADSVTFVGRVPHAQVPQELAKLDIYVALSRLDSESFGVAIIEAGAAGRPVVVSDAGGLPEVTVEGETGFIVPRENPQAAADAIEKLVMDAELRCRMGRAAQAHAAKYYSWDACIQTMLGVYDNTIRKHRLRA